MPYDFELSAEIPASCEDVFAAWMSGEMHSAMTGGAASVDPVVGGRFTAWDGYISGTTILLESPNRIIQTWRTSEFSESDPDSQVEVRLTPTEGGCQLTLRHSMVPDDQLGYENGGWQENYFEPMQEYFAVR